MERLDINYDKYYSLEGETEIEASYKRREKKYAVKKSFHL